MSKVKKTESPKKTAPQQEKKTAKKIKFVFNKPDFSKLKSGNYKPLIKIFGLVVIVVGSFALIDLAVQYLNNDYSVAVVNGSRVSKALWHDRLEKAYGATVATQLIEDQIIKQEAKKADISSTDEEIDAKVEEIRVSIGGEELLQSALVANNITMEELREQISLDILYNKILSPSIEYTEEDVKDFFNQYSDVIFPEATEALEEGEKLDYEANKEKTQEIYLEQQVLTMKNSWLAEKKTEYSIQDNSTNKPKYGFLTTTTNIVKNLIDSLNKTEE